MSRKVFTLPLIAASLLLATDAARGHSCGPPVLDLVVGESVDWGIFAGPGEGVTFYALEGEFGDPNAARISSVEYPDIPFVSEGEGHGLFLIEALAPGTVTYLVFWDNLNPDFGQDGTCGVTVNVTEGGTGGGVFNPNGWIQTGAWTILGPLVNPGDCSGGGPEQMALSPIAPALVQDLGFNPLPGDVHDGDVLPAIDFGGEAASLGYRLPGLAPDPTWFDVALLEDGFPGAGPVPQGDLVNLFAIGAWFNQFVGPVGLEGVLGVAVTYVDNVTGAPYPVGVCSSSDDSIQVFVNDVEVTRESICRGDAGGCSETRGVYLPPGVSKIAAVIWQGAGGWGFRLGLTENVDGPLITDDTGTLRFLGSNDGSLFGQPQPLSIDRVTQGDALACGDRLRVTLLGTGVDKGDVTDVTEIIEVADPASLVITEITGGGFVTDPPFPITGLAVTWPGASVAEILNGELQYTVAAGPGEARFSGHASGLAFSEVSSACFVAPQLPAGGFDRVTDVGVPPLAGSTTYDGATDSYTMSGTGFDIWDTGDTFQFGAREVAGDFRATVRVTNVDAPNTGRWGRYGLMVRRSCEADSKYSAAVVPFGAADDTRRHQSRAVHGVSSGSRDQQTLGARAHAEIGPRTGWIGLTRVGDYFFSEFAADAGGAPGRWHFAGGDTHAEAQATYLVGFFVGGHSSMGAQLIDVTFDRFNIEPLTPPFVPPLVTGPEVLREEFGPTFPGPGVDIGSNGVAPPGVVGGRLAISSDVPNSANAVWLDLNGHELGTGGLVAEFDLFVAKTVADENVADGMTLSVLEASFPLGGRVGSAGSGLGADIGDHNAIPSSRIPGFNVEIDPWSSPSISENDPPGVGSNGVSLDTYHVAVNFNEETQSARTNVDLGVSLPRVLSRPSGVRFEVVYQPLPDTSTSLIEVFASANDGTFPRTRVNSAFGPKLEGDVVLGFTAGTGRFGSDQLVDNVVVRPISRGPERDVRLGPDGNYWEVVFAPGLSFADAAAAASLLTFNGIQGELAPIFSTEIQDFLETVIDDPSTPDGSFFSGDMQRPDQSNPLCGWPGDTRWAPGQPDDAGETIGIEDNEENFRALGPDGFSDVAAADDIVVGYVVRYTVPAEGSYDFDVSGPLASIDIPQYLELLGDVPFAFENWNIFPNELDPTAGNALYSAAPAQLADWFGSVAVVRDPERDFVEENAEVSAKISWTGDGTGVVYARFQGQSNDPLGNSFYYASVRGGADPENIALGRVKDGVHEVLATAVGPVAGPGITRRVTLAVAGSELRVSIDGVGIDGLFPFVDTGDVVTGEGRVAIGQNDNPAFFDGVDFSRVDDPDGDPGGAPPRVERFLPECYEPGGTFPVALVGMDLASGSTIVETFPEGMTVLDDGGGKVRDQSITFSDLEPGVEIVYVLEVPEEFFPDVRFSGTVEDADECEAPVEGPETLECCRREVPLDFEPGPRQREHAVPITCTPCSAQWEPCSGRLDDFGEPADVGRTALDSVYLFSGEYYARVTDLRIPGRGFDFVWARKYRSRVGKDTPMGSGWDFSYNIRLERTCEDLILHNGNTRQDIYERQSDDTWTKEEFFRVLVLNPDGTYTLRLRHGAEWNFHPFSFAPAPGWVSSIVDRNGNTMRFEYEPVGRLVRIVDTLDREITIQHGGDGLIDSITDFTGRSVVYGHASGNLVSVTSPEVTGTPNGNDFPLGKTTIYGYGGGLLTSITDPLGRVVLQNRYEAASPGDDAFGRVTRQLRGDPPEIVDVVYVDLTPDPVANNDAVVNAIVNDRAGNVKEVFFDDRNRRVMLREFTGRADPDAATSDILNRPRRPLRPSDPELIETRQQNNDDALPVRIDHADGSVRVNVFQLELDPAVSRLSHPDLRELQHLPGPLAGDQGELLELFEYDPDFQFVTRHVDARGHDTVHEYDGSGNRVRTRHRIASIVEDFEYNQFGQRTLHVLPDNGGEHRRRDECVWYDSGPARGYLRDFVVDVPNFAITESWEYDEVGNVVRHVDPRGHDTLFAVNQLDQVVRELSRPVAVGSDTRIERTFFFDANDNLVRTLLENRDERGALRANTHIEELREYDASNRLSRIEREVDQDHFAVTDLEYDAGGRLAVERRGEAVSGAAPFDIVRFAYDERGLLFRRIEAAGSPAQTTTQFDYDVRGRLVRKWRGLESTTGAEMVIHDGYGRVVSVEDAMGNVTTTRYDANGNPVERRVHGELVDVEGGDGNVLLEHVLSDHDAMDRLVREERGFFEIDTSGATPSAVPSDDGVAVTEFGYSDTSQVLRVTDDRGNSTRTVLDTANRRRELVDSKGNRIVFTYDASSNVIERASIERSDLARPDEVVTARAEHDPLDRAIARVDGAGHSTRRGYDSRGNVTLVVDALGHRTHREYDGLGRITRERAGSTGGGGAEAALPAITESVWDDSSRLRATVDPNGNRTEYEYDDAGRLARIRFADGTVEEREHDARGALVRLKRRDGTELRMTRDGLGRLTRLDVVTRGPDVSADTTFERFEYDGLSRLVLAEDDDSRVERRWNSLSRLVEEAVGGRKTRYERDATGNAIVVRYPGGRIVRFAYDGLGRARVVADGANGETPIASAWYAGPAHLERIEPANDLRSDFERGAAGRVARVTHSRVATGAALDEREHEYDPRGDLIVTRRQLSSGGLESREHEYDALGRLARTAERIEELGRGPRLTREIVYSLDAAGNRVSVRDSARTARSGDYVLDATTPDPADRQVHQYTETPFDVRAYDRNGNLVAKAEPSAGARGPLFIRGDCDGDGRLTVSDTIRLLSFGFLGAAAPPCMAACDANGDGAVLGFVTDGVFILNYLYLGGPTPASPFPACAPDPGGSGLSCDRWSFCRATAAGDVELVWDALGRLVEVIDGPSGVRHEYRYDALGRRIGKTLDAGGAANETRYFHDHAGRVIEEQSAAGVTLATHVWFGREIVSTRRGAADVYHHGDGRGRTIMLTDETGAVLERYAHEDFGEPVFLDASGAPTGQSAPASGNELFRRGAIFDPETGHFLEGLPGGDGVFDPTVGRFIGGAHVSPTPP